MAARFRLLGAIGADRDDRPLDLGHARQQCVLVVLLIEANATVLADQLIDRVWGANPSHGARNTLHTYVARLRRVLSAVPEATIVRSSGGYQLMVDENLVDLHRFRSLVTQARSVGEHEQAFVLLDQALDLWRGEAFTGLDTRWLADVRATLEQQRAAAELDRTDLALRLGRHTELLPELSSRLAQHPLDERVTGQLMLALYRSGRQAEALQAFHDTRQALADELGIDPSAALQDLHQRMLTSDATLVIGTAPRAAQSVVTPQQLPAAPEPFVGRRDEVDRLDALLRDSSASATVVFSVLAGSGGIGKTWLALHWAHRNLDRFPDGQLFVDLRGFSPDSAPMDSAVAVRGFLDALGVHADQVPMDPHAQAGLFRSLVADKRMLIVLDNAADTTQTTPLLPGGRACTVLITSRHWLPGLLAGHGAHHLHLGRLTEQEARTVLAGRLGIQRVTAEAAAVAELLRLCGGFPLALGILAAQAHTHPDVSLAEFAVDLHELGLNALADDDPAASLPAVLSWSLRALTPEQRQAFALLGIAPGPDIGLHAAASLTGLSLAHVRVLLRGLEQASLLVRDPHGRYRMHDLIRLYAAEQTHDCEINQENALRRIVDHYLHTAYAADRLLEPHREPIQRTEPPAGCHPHPLRDQPAALAWFTAEHPNLLAAQQLAVAQGWHSPVWQLAWALDTFHWRRGRNHDNLAVWQAGQAATTHLDDPTVKALAHRRLGDAYTVAGRHTKALPLLEQALVLTEQAADTRGRAQTHQYLAALWDQQGNDQRALEHATQALHLFQTIDHPVGQARALNSIGWLHAKLGHIETARAHCEAALNLSRRHHNRIIEAATLDSLGYLAHSAGHYVQALHHYQRSLLLRHALGHNYGQADTLNHLGQTHHALGQHDQARHIWQQALALYQAQHRTTDAAHVQQQLDASNQ
jgi:DNA-binding SARP family transcriptional activator/tetratricopeptide (TPR) repeat protein